MRDVVAQNLIADICQLHEDLCASLDHDVDLAALGLTEPASGKVTGSSDHDRMDTTASAVRQAEHERDRQLKNARQELRRVVDYYQTGGRRQPRRPRVESIDYRNGSERRVG
jgi:hypothetical protein